jgi:hypothetical protein
MMMGLPAVRLLFIPIIVGGIYWSNRDWEKFGREHGFHITKKLKRGASVFEIAQVGMELEAFHRERIRSLRDRARTDPKAARDLSRMLRPGLAPSNASYGKFRQRTSRAPIPRTSSRVP